MPTLTIALPTPDDKQHFANWTRTDGLGAMTCRPVVDGRRVPPSGETFIWSFFAAGDPVPVGRFSWFDVNPRNRSAEFGYAVRPDQRGRGVGRAMLGVAFDRLFAELGFNKLYCQTCVANLASVRMLERLGLRRDGVLREHHEIDGRLVDDVIYSVLQREWQALRRESA